MGIQSTDTVSTMDIKNFFMDWFLVLISSFTTKHTLRLDSGHAPATKVSDMIFLKLLNFVIFVSRLKICFRLPAAACPRGKVLVGRESTHVSPGFCQHSLAPRSPTPAIASSFSTAARNEGALPPPAARSRCDLLFEKIVLSEQLAQQKAVMLGQLSFQSALQLGNLGAKLTLGQICQHRRRLSLQRSALQSSCVPTPPAHHWPPSPV